MFFRKRIQTWINASRRKSCRHELRVALARQSLQPRFEVLEERALLATVTWDGGASTFNWNDALNWDTNSLPTAADDAVVPDLTGTPTITVSGSTTVKSITASEKIAFSSGTITISNASTFSQGLDLSGATLSSNAPITTPIGSASTWSSGTIGRALTTTSIVNQGTWNFNGVSSRSLLNATFNNEWIFIQSAGQMVIDTSTFNNTVTGSYTHQSGAVSPAITTVGGSFENAGGYLYVSSGPGSVSGTFNSSGQVIVNQVGANFSLTGGGTHSGTASVTVGAVFSLSGGTTTIQAGATFAGPGVTEFKAGAVNVTGNASFANLQLNSNPLTVTVSAAAVLTTTGSSLWQSGATVTGAGTWTNTGTLDASTISFATANLGGTVTLANQGTLNMSPAGAFVTAVGTSITNAVGASLTIRSVSLNGSLTNLGTAITSAGMNIGSSATITNTATGTYNLTGTGSINGAGTSSFTNAGLLQRTTSGGTYGIATAFSNTGTVDVQAGTLSLTGTVVQLTGSTFDRTLAAGTWSAQSGSTLSFPAGNTIRTIANGATVSLVGSGSSALPGISSGLTVAGTLSVTVGATMSGGASGLIVSSTGSLTVGAGSSFNTLASLSNAGNVIVGGSIPVLAYSQSAGITLLTGGTLLKASLTGGILAGTGTINGNVDLINATLAPGASPGILNITGNLTLNAGSITNIEVQGTNPFTPDFDQILVSGTATLAGTLNVSLLNGFIPDKSEAFQIMSFASRLGDFTTQNFPSYSNYKVFASSPGATTYTLTGSAYTVRNTNDSGNNSLRKAITDANLTPGADAILFNIAGAGVQTITPLSGLPTTSGQLVIDATSQAGYAGTPLIEIRGDSAGNVYGVAVSGASGSGSVIKGLAINRFQLSGVLIINGANGVTVQNNYIGTDASGTVAKANNNIGVDINRSSGTIVSNNLISGNADYGIGANAGGVAGSVNGTVITGNRIGTNALGTAAIGNAAGGIYLGGATDTTIGGTTIVSRNVISGNSGNGVDISGPGSIGNKLLGNYIGVGADGSTDLGNSNGVSILDAPGNFVGGGLPGAGNVISGNATDVSVYGSGATGNRIQGNRISMTADGLSLIVPSLSYGVYVANGATDTFIGTDSNNANDTTEGNLIGFASTAAIFLQDNGAAPNRTVIAGNRLGLNALGSALSIGGRGIWVQGATNTRIGSDSNGTSDDDERNVIVPSAISAVGILLTGGSFGATTGTTIAGNYIGLDAAGENGLSNYTDGGIALVADVGTGISNTLIGGTQSSAKNVIGSLNIGIELSGALVSNNRIEGNYVGTDKVGDNAIANSEGILIDAGASNNTVGGTIAAARNIISGNSSNGVKITGATTTGNKVEGNYIGTDFSALAPVAQANNTAWLRAEGTATDSAGSNNGTLNGGVSYTAGKVGQAFDLPGNVGDYVRVPDSPALSPTAAISVELWVKGTAPTGLSYLLAKGPANGGNASYAFYTLTGGLQFYVSAASGLTLSADAGGSIWNNAWHHVVGVYDGASVQLYVDGVQVGTGSAANGALQYNASAFTPDLFVGTYALVPGVYPSGNLPFKGQLDEIGVFNRALTPTEIQKVASQGGRGVAIPNVTGVNLLNGATNNTIGGTTVGARNVISGNTVYGIIITGAGTNNNTVAGNYIGTNAAGTAILGNTNGVTIDSAPGNFIGGGASGAGNLISGNLGEVVIYGSTAVGNKIQGNIIDENAAGTALLYNASESYPIIETNGAAGTIIGTDSNGVNDGGERNIIAGAGTGAIFLQDQGTGGPTGTVIAGNYIGLNKAGTAAIGTTSSRNIWLQGAINTRIGTNADGINDLGERNVIAAGLNYDTGILITYGTSGTVIAGNNIGTDASGLNAVAAFGALGIIIATNLSDTISNTTIGGTDPGGVSRNVIGGFFTGIGVEISGAGVTGTTIAGNYIGVDATGAHALGNQYGVLLSISSGTTVGGALVAARNIISGNTSAGVQITGVGTSNNTVLGNYIGTNAAGTAAVGNAVGVLVQSGATGNTIGGSTLGARNIISGNTADGVDLFAPSNTVAGNYIGVDLSGNVALGNLGSGVDVQAAGNTIGGTVAGAGNVISGNTGAGVIFYNSTLGAGPTPATSLVAGNIIGLGADGSTSLGNSAYGVTLAVDDRNITVGGTTAAARNVISGNASFGIYSNNTSDGLLVQGNYIGTTANGLAARPNTRIGVYTTSSNVTIGGPTATPGTNAGNVIAANGSFPADEFGIVIAFASGAVIQGNIVGLGADGATVLNNFQNAGIYLQSATNATVGGTGAGNLISGNSGFGIYAVAGSGNTIASNLIGTDITGTLARPNQFGISLVSGSHDNTIGGTTAGARNVISGNSNSGVSIDGVGTSNNTVAGNTIGLNAAGKALGNAKYGVWIENGATNNKIGGTASGAGNVISGNTNVVSNEGIGVLVQADGNHVLGNLIGTNAVGTSALGNNIGVWVQGNLNNVGGTTAGAGNVISGNTDTGLRVQGATNTLIAANLIGTNAAGNAAIGNISQGIFLTGASTGNTIGGTTAAARNVISGNRNGVRIQSSSNTVSGNYIGTNAAGTGAVGNSTGVLIEGGATLNTVGSVVANGANNISGNSVSGILIDGASKNTINGNKIGVSSLGIVLPNAIGIRVVNASPSNVFNDNDVRGSTSDNFLIEAAGNILRRNASAGMGGLPIRLNPASLTPGAITVTQLVAGNNPLIQGEVHAQSNQTYTVDLFSNPVPAEADRFVTSSTVTTDVYGFGLFSIVPPVGQLNGYVSATLTGPGSNGSTSQLSNSLLATPAIILGLRSQSPEGTPITLTAFASSNPVTGYLWEVKKDGLPYAFELRSDGTQNDGGIQFTPDDEGVYTVSLRVTLSSGTQSLLGPYAINVYNVAPTPSFQYAPSIIAAGNAITLTSNNSDPGQLDVLRNSWEVRSGSPTGAVVYSAPLSTSLTTSFTPSAGGFYYATMTVDDGDGGVRSLTRELAVNGLPTTTTIIVPDTSVLEGQTVRARAPESELNRTEQLIFNWLVSKTPAVGPTVSYPFKTPSRGVVEFVPDDNGTYTIALTISDGVSSVVATPQTVVVGNVAPRVRITTSTTSLTTGVPVNLTSWVTDPGTADTQTLVWSVTRDRLPFGTSASNANYSFTPTQPGIYIVTATATDDDGGIGTTERGFALLANVPTPPAVPPIPNIPVVPPIPAIPTVPPIPSPPTTTNPAFIASAVAIAIIPPTGPFAEGSSYVFHATVPAGATTYAWKARNATGFQVASASTSSFSFTPSQGGSYQIELAVTLADGRRGFAVFAPMAVLGTAPTINSMAVVSPSTSPIYEGTAVTVRTLAVDTRESIGLNYKWELKKPGEVSYTELSGVDGAPTDFRFVPSNQGSYDVRVSISDSQGLITTRTLSVAVSNADPLVRVSGSLDPANANLINLTAIASDPGAADVPNLRYEWSVNNVNAGVYSAPSTSNQFSANRNALTNAKVRVTDGDGGSVVVDYYIIVGAATTSSTPFVVNLAVATAAGTADQILYLGTDGNDYVNIAAGVTKKVVVFGGLGNDVIDASAATGSVLLDGGDGDDILTGGSGDDVLIAGIGTNVLVGGAGKNRFIGGGNDTMTGGVDSDYYEVHFSTVVLNDTAGGLDTIDLSAAQAGVTLNLSTNTGMVAQPVFTGSFLTLNGSFERLLGSKLNDDLTTSTPGTEIDGGEGNDRITSTAINTKISGGLGADTIVLAGAGGSIDGGDGADTISGTIAPGSVTQIATGAGNDIVDINGASTTLLSSVSISLGDGNNSLTASRITGKVYATNGGSSQSINAFGTASTAVSTISVSSSSDIDIFGSASMGSTVTATGGSDVSIFGSGVLTMNGVMASGLNRNSITTAVFGSATPTPTLASVSSSSNVDIFGSALPSGPSLSATILSSTNIDIFGSASPTGLNLDATINSSSNIDIFGSASAGMSMVKVENGSTDVSIFGSASPTGGALQATVSSSTNVDIFGSASSASSGVTTVTVTGSSDIDIFGSASPNAGNLSATMNSSTNVDIFGAASGGTTTVTANGTSQVDIFGSASPGTTRVDVVNSSGVVSIFGSASSTGSNLSASVSGSSNVDIFGSASSGATTVSVLGSSNIDIFGSASPNAGSLSATVSSSTNVDIFGAASGGTTTVTALGTSNVDIFGSASPGTTRVDVVNSTSNVNIFGSALPTGSNLTASVSSSSNVDIFGAASPGGTTVTLSGSSNIDIFGSALPNAGNLTASLSSSTNVDIFGTASGGTTTVTALGTSNVDIFGSASPGTTRVDVVNSTSNVNIFGSASPTGSNLTASISSSSNVAIFGSASSGVTTVSVSGSSNIDIFGSASPTGSGLTATISSSTNVDIFGSASAGTTTVTVNNGSTDISIFGSASPIGSSLNATVNSSSDVSIFGSASAGTTTVSVINGSSKVSIFGSASPTGSNLNVTVSSSSDIGIFGSAVGNDHVTVTGSGDIGIYGIGLGQVSLSGVSRAVIEAVAFGTAAIGPVVVDVTSSTNVDIFGSATPGPILNATVTGSSNVDIFGSASPGTITVITSQNVDIFGSASTGTVVTVTGSSDIDIYSGRGDQITLQAAKRTRIDGGVFGSASGPGISVIVNGGSTEVGIFGTSAQDSVRVGKGSYIGMDLRGDDDTVEIDGAEHVVVLTDDGVDRVTVRSGSDMLLYLGAGADRAEILGGQSIRLIGEEGDDEMMVANGSEIQVDGGNGNDKVFITGGNGINVRGDAGDDRVDIYGGVGISVVGGIGNDTLRVFGSLGGALCAGQVYALLDGQDDNDVLEIRPLLSVTDRGPIAIASVDAPYLYFPNWMTIPTWISAPTVTSFTSSVALVGGNGTNSLWLEGSQRLYGIGGDDVDKITLQQGSNGEVTGGRDADIITIRATGSDNRVFGDQGNDVIDAYAGTRLGIFGEEDVDSITFHDGQDGFARGGDGNDMEEILDGSRMVLAGEAGRDTLTIRGGISGVAAGGTGDDTLEITGGSLGLLLGQTGNDLLKATGGTQSIVSGGDGDDVIEASNRGDDLYGDDGDDEYRILSTTSTNPLLRLRELLYVDPNNFEPEARGSDTIDLSAFSSPAVLNLGTVGLFNDPTAGKQTVIPSIPSQLQLILLGSLENIIGTSADDTLTGNSESNRLEGRGGNDTLLGQAGDDTLEGGTGNDTMDGGSGDDLYVFKTQAVIPLGTDTIYEADRGGIDGLDFSGMPVGLRTLDLNLATTQNLSAGLLSLTLRQSSSNAATAEVEEVIGTDYNDTIFGNALDNRIEPKGGSDIVDGRSGSDIYVFAGSNLGSDQIIDTPTGTGRDTLDFVGFDGPINLDLALTTTQNLGGMSLTLSAGDSIENVLGTSFDDTIYGNALDNAIYGGAGADTLDGRAGNDRITADLPAVVLLDFDSSYRADRGDYLYSATERAAIQQRLIDTYRSFNWTFTQYESVVPFGAPTGSQSAKDLTSDMGRSFVRIAFSQGRGGGVSGDAGEVDFRNIRRRLTTEVNINPLLPAVRQMLAEQVGANYTPQQYSDMVVALTSTIAGHELAHTAGLRHGDSFGPIGSGMYALTDASNVYPADVRPANATETGWHMLASPASVGTPLSDAARKTFFGEREAIKMAFNEIGRSRLEANSAAGSHSGTVLINDSLVLGSVNAEDLGSLPKLYVPNLIPSNLLPPVSFVRAGQTFNVSATAVIGELKTLANTTTTELDFYKFNGAAGDIVNIELLASSIRPLRGEAFDGELRIYKPDGTLLAFNDDDFEGTRDATLLDIVLPQAGSYFVSVGLSRAPAINSPGGRYELFISRFSAGVPGPVVGDTIVGGLGTDTLIGSAADDTFYASVADTVQGRGGVDTTIFQGTPPVLSAITQPAPVVELANASAQDLAPINGTLFVKDLDIGDTITASIVGTPSVTLSSGGSVPASVIAALTASGVLTFGSAITSTGIDQTIGFTYNPGPANLDFIRAGDSLRVVYTVKVKDGTTDSATQSITISITGSNDTATISGPSTGALTEDAATIVASGILNVTDPDMDEAFFQTPTLASLAGTYGDFTFNETTGVWNYTLANIRPATDNLIAGQIVTEILTVKSLDGTASRAIIVTITGAGVGGTTNRFVQTLNAMACGSLTLSGNAQINVNGPVIVNSICTSSAVSLSGNTQITATQVRIVGGARVTGTSRISPSPITGAIATPDPLAALAAPSGSPATTALSCSGNSIMTVSPGSYTRINATDYCRLTFQPGIYIIDGGGMNVSLNANVTGNGVMFYNAGSNFPSLGGSFGSLSFSGNAIVNLTPPTTGVYSGITFFQARDNLQQLSLSGNATGIKGSVYAPKAQAVLSGNGQLQMTMIVDRLSMSGNAISALTAGSTFNSDYATMAPLLGQLNTGTLRVSIDNSLRLASREQLDRIRDAIQTINTDFGPFGVRLVEMDPTGEDADIRLKVSNTSACGSAEDGILGCSTKWGEITIVEGWSWYADPNPLAIPNDRFDYQTIVTHELGHAIGLEHSSDNQSTMYAVLDTGIARRKFAVHDLALLTQAGDSPDDDLYEALRAGILVKAEVALQSQMAAQPIVPLAGMEQKRAVDVIMNEWYRDRAINTEDNAPHRPGSFQSKGMDCYQVRLPIAIKETHYLSNPNDDLFFELFGNSEIDLALVIKKGVKSSTK